MFIREPFPDAPWMSTMESAHLEWLESVQSVFDYFCERTPRSFVERRETSLVWNYKFSDPEFGRLQARSRSQSRVCGRGGCGCASGGMKCSLTRRGAGAFL